MLYVLFKKSYDDKDYVCGQVICTYQNQCLQIKNIFTDEEDIYVGLERCVGIETERIAHINSKIGDRLDFKESTLQVSQIVEILDMSISYKDFRDVYLHITYKILDTGKQFIRAYAI
jgi:hypothetical protein